MFREQTKHYEKMPSSTMYPAFDEPTSLDFRTPLDEQLQIRKWLQTSTGKLFSAKYCSDENVALMKGVLEQNGVDFTVRNADIAFQMCLDSGTLEQVAPEPEPKPTPAERGVQHIAGTLIGREATADDSPQNIARLKSLSDAELKREAYSQRWKNRTLKEEPVIRI
jgi:hypothetical protein